MRPFDFTGRPMTGWIYVEGSAVATGRTLGRGWRRLGLRAEPSAEGEVGHAAARSVMLPKALVVGASGVVGYSAVRHFVGAPGWQVVGASRRIPTDLDGATLVSLDLLDPEACRALAVSTAT